jgi:hypothetical protein
VWEIKFLLQQLSKLCSFYPKVPNLSLQMKEYCYVSVNLSTETQDGHICTALFIKPCFLCFSHRDYWIHMQRLDNMLRRLKNVWKNINTWVSIKQISSVDWELCVPWKYVRLCDTWETLHLYFTWNAYLTVECGPQWYSAWFLCPRPRVQSQQHKVGQ